MKSKTTKAEAAPQDERVRAEVTIRWAPAAKTALGIVATPLGVTGEYRMHWGDGTHVDGAGQSPVARHVYPAAGSYTLTLVQNEAMVAQQQVHVRATLEPQVTLSPASDNPNIIDALFDDDPEELASRYELVWEDGATPVQLWAPKGTVTSHGYQAGTYTVTIRDLHTGRAKQEQITVQDPVYDPDFSLGKGGDVRTARAEITHLETSGKDVLLDWGDGAQTTLPAAKVGDTANHAYTADDTYIVQCVYVDGSTDGSARTVTIPFPA
ncbi:hypothetical protein IL38_24140 [Actinopolyspora erythraea]|uniref:PKD domain-containing protein n=1 Tax=Actinopolyspora erythraea TaxID=414996 RepID=A0ABR4WYD0_9ACTN|nr:hypothetical protein [Actinopolyspora erythraea]KGI79389.1 hypothetical protein IL38_24140 [Actinopolyspora erythraea]